MAQKRRFTPSKGQAARMAPQTRTLQRLPDVSDLPPRVVYGKPFLLLEDAEKNTFIYKAGDWVPHTATIAECRQTCQVKQLSQQVNGRIRYEVREPQ